MKMTIQQQTLKETFDTISKFRGKGLLQHIHLSAKTDGLTFRSTDGDVTYEKRVTLADKETVTEAGDLLLPPKFEEVVRKLSSGVINIELLENGQIEIKQAPKTKVKVNGVESELPGVPEHNKSDGIALNTEVLSKLVLSTSFAASDKDARPILKAIHMESDDKSFKVVATDSHRLSQMLIPKPFKIPKMNIPAKKLLDVISTLEEKANLTLIPAGSHLVIQTNDRDIYIRLLEGEYPALERLIDCDSKLKITVSRKQVLGAIDRALTFAKDEKHRSITLDPKETVLLIHSATDDTGSIEEEMDAKVEGEASKFTINAKFVIDALKAFVSDEVTFHIQGPEKPIFIFSEKEPAITQLVLPIRTT